MSATRSCSLRDCDNPQHARGWCLMHYHRWRRHGDPRTLVRPPLTSTLRIPLTAVDPDKRAMAWAAQQRYDAKIAKLQGT